LGQAYRDMGKLCLLSGHPDQAIVYLKKVEQLAPEEPTTHYLMAQAYRKIGNPTQVKAELEIFQKLKQQETARASKQPDISGLGGVDSSNERPQEDLSPDDLK
jgi:tetratricopeptide (TPR) repeat protein